MSLSELSYKDLQNLAKENGIRANQKKEDLLDQLSTMDSDMIPQETLEAKEEDQEDAASEQGEEEQELPDFDSMKYSELRKLASSYGLKSTGRKDILIERITEHLTSQEEEEVEEEEEEEQEVVVEEEVEEEEVVVEEQEVDIVEEEQEVVEEEQEVVVEEEQDVVEEEEDIDIHITQQEQEQEQPQDMLSALVDECEHLEWVDYKGVPRVRCTLTNHVMIPSLTGVLAHLESKKVKRALEAEEVDLLCMLHGLQVIRRDAVPAFIEGWEAQQYELGTMKTIKHVPRIVSSDMVFCPLTQTLLSKRVRDINNHIKGKNFQKALRDEAQQQNYPSSSSSSRSYSSMDSMASDQIMNAPLSPEQKDEEEGAFSYKLNGIASPKNKHMVFSSPEPQNENMDSNLTSTPKSLRSTPTRARRTSLRLSNKKKQNQDANLLADLCQEESQEDPVTWYGDFSY